MDSKTVERAPELRQALVVAFFPIELPGLLSQTLVRLASLHGLMGVDTPVTLVLCILCLARV